MTNWIAITERLPEQNDRVLLFDADSEGGGRIVQGYRSTRDGLKKTKWMAENYGYDGDDGPAPGVTHWMPLPPPPPTVALEPTPPKDCIVAGWLRGHEFIGLPEDVRAGDVPLYSRVRK